jgi:hypothetical protein
MKLTTTQTLKLSTDDLVVLLKKCLSLPDNVTLSGDYRYEGCGNEEKNIRRCNSNFCKRSRPTVKINSAEPEHGAWA